MNTKTWWLSYLGLATCVLALSLPANLHAKAEPPCPPGTGPGGIKAGSYPPTSLTQDQRQWLFGVFGHVGLAPVGYGGEECTRAPAVGTGSRGSWSLDWTPSYSLAFDPAKWFVDSSYSYHSALASTFQDGCYITQVGPQGGPDASRTEILGGTAYLVVGDIGQGSVGYLARDAMDMETHTYPWFSVVDPTSGAVGDCLNEAKIVLSTLHSVGALKPAHTGPAAEAPQPGDGRDPGLDVSSSPFAVQAAASAQDQLTPGQCTWFVAGKRPDVVNWLGTKPWHAYLWADRARANGGKSGVSVGSAPERGDIAVWSADCQGTSPNPAGGPCSIGSSGSYEGCGHVAYVTSTSADHTVFRVEEANWNRANPDILVDRSCMRFIRAPRASQIQPTGKPSNSILENIWNWLGSLFSGR